MNEVINKFIILLFGSTLLSLQMVAQNVVASDAFEIAHSFMSKKGVTLVNEDRAATRGRPEPYSIFIGKHGKGFAIVANGIVIGYSTKERANAENIPPQLKALLENVYSKTRNYSPRKRNPIEPLVKTKWNQGEPYNLHCPIVDGRHCVTGCVATAIAQVMNYHKYPQSETTEIPAYDKYGSLPPTRFQWDNMLDVYEYGNYNDIQGNAVAELMQYIGYSHKMYYSLSESGSSPNDRACIDYFGYNKFSTILIPSLFNDRDFEDLIFYFLNRSLPIVAVGKGVPTSYHAFVVDGCDSDGYFHCNWGWGGWMDGHYLLMRQLYDNNVNGINYINEIEILFPDNKVDEDNDSQLVRLDYYGGGTNKKYPEGSVYRTTNTITRSSFSDDFEELYTGLPSFSFKTPRNMDMALGLFDGDKMLSMTDCIRSADCCAPICYPTLNGENIFTYRFSFGKGVGDGKYALKWLSRISGTEKWYKAWGADVNYLDVTISGNQAVVTSAQDNSTASSQLDFIDVFTKSITIGKSGKASYCGDKSLDFSYSDEVKAYIATGYDKDAEIIWLTRVMDVPAGVPVLIKGEANKTYDVPVTDSQNSYYKNMFKGNTSGDKIQVNETEANLVNYYLSGDGTFKSVKGYVNIDNNKCYLQLPGTFNPAVAGATQTVTVGASGKASYAAPVDLDFTNVEGLKAFTATGYDKSSKTIWLTRVMKVQKGEGILLKGDAKDYQIPSVAVQSSYMNMFVGNTSGASVQVQEKSEDGSRTNFYLKGDGSFVSVNGFVNIGNNKCYLELPTSMVAVAASTRGTEANYLMEEPEIIKMPVFRSIGNNGDDTTGIKVQSSMSNALSDAYYTLQGQRVTKPGKGLYIKNGKKIVIK